MRPMLPTSLVNGQLSWPKYTICQVVGLPRIFEEVFISEMNLAERFARSVQTMGEPGEWSADLATEYAMPEGWFCTRHSQGRMAFNSLTEAQHYISLNTFSTVQGGAAKR